MNIELGAAWIKRVLIIPLCHSGLTPSDFPWPFADFHAVILSKEEVGLRLTGGVADALNLTYSRRLHFESVLKEMRAAALASKVDVVIAAPVEVSVDRLPEDQAALLVIIAEVKNSGSTVCTSGSCRVCVV